MLGIVDADFGKLEGTDSPSANLFVSDTHDLETLLLSSKAFNRVLIELGSEKKIIDLFNGNYEKIRDTILDIGIWVGYLRWVSIRDGLNLKFEGIVYSKFIDRNLQINVREMIVTVKNNSQRQQLQISDVVESINALKRATENDPWQICCGHDLVNILGIGLQRLFGTRNSNEVRPEVIEAMLRLAFGKDDLEGTILFSQIENWETKTGYLVLQKV